VVSLDALRGLEQRGTVYDEGSGTTVKHTLRSLFETDLAMRYGILLGGANATAGFGKTQFCYRLAIELARAITVAASRAPQPG